MSNSFAAILPVLQEQANVVGRNLVGFIPACYKNTSAARAGLNQTVNYPIIPTLTTATVAPAATAPAGTDMTPTAGSIIMDQMKKTSWNWTGEERRALENGDIAPYKDIFAQTIQGAMNVLVNLIENSLWVEAYKNSSAGFGTAAATPFGTAADMTDFANLTRILNDNGAPINDRHLVLGGAAWVNLTGKQSVLFKVNEAGTDDLLRRGSLGEVLGWQVHNSFPITTVTAGTNNGAATTDSAGYAIGATTLALASAGTGTILQGDLIAITGDASGRKYGIKTGDTDVSNGGTFVLSAPGLRGTLSAATHVLTTTATYTANIGLQRQGLHLVMRAPDPGNDLAATTGDVTEVTDDFSGLTFQLARYGQYMQETWELRVLYGVKAANPHLICTLIG